LFLLFALALAVALFSTHQNLVILSEVAHSFIVSNAVEGPEFVFAFRSCSCSCPFSTHQNLVILSEVAHSFIVSNAVEGPAFVLNNPSTLSQHTIG
jgi:hypothetical protein